MAFTNPFEAHRNVGIPMQQGTWTDHRFEGEDWAGMTFQDCVFERTVFDSVNLLQAKFVECRFVDCSFDACRVINTSMTKCTGTSVRLQGGTCRELVLSECDFGELYIGCTGRQLLFSQCGFGELHFGDTGLRQEVMTLSDCEIGTLFAADAEWIDGSAVGVDLANWRISGASFTRCSFIRTVAEGVDLSSATFVSCNLYQAHLRGATFRSVEKCMFAECELDDADLSDARAQGSLYAKSHAHRCRFDSASMSGALFPETDLTGASFEGADAPGSVWVDANLTDANLERLSALRGTFRNACLTGATMHGSDLREADLHGVEGDLTAADTRDARGSVEWRAERERELRRLREDSAQA